MTCSWGQKNLRVLYLARDGSDGAVTFINAHVPDSTSKHPILDSLNKNS